MIKIVWLFGELMSLYGEHAALEFLKRRLEEAGEETLIERVEEGGELNLSDCSLLYIPAGTEKSLLAAARHIAAYKQEIDGYCARGGLALLTGNAPALFCREIKSFGGSKAEGLGIFDGEAEILDKRRYSEFIMRSNILLGYTIGAINSSLKLMHSETPLFKVLFDAAKILPERSEGIVKGGVFATQLIGPLLVRNPAALDFFASKAAGHEL
ncbi:MAG: hypothetical protein Q4B42_06625, partial [Oscillospiraceae bacterium]|nr:hypothetical protein [Oscillospiraceae bacterium]